MGISFTATSAITNAYEATENLLSIKQHIPIPAWLMFQYSPVNKIIAVWRLWRLQREVQSIVKPEHQSIVDAWAMRAAEGVLNQFEVLRVVSYIMLVSHRITKCRQIMGNISETYSDLKAAFRARDLQLSLQHPQWTISNPEGSCFSPSTYNWTASKITNFSHSLWRIATCIVRLFYDVFSLSMYFLDVVDAYFIDIKKGDDVQIRHFFNHSIESLNDLLENQRTALKFLEDEKEMATTLLSQIGGKYTYDGLIAFLNVTTPATAGACAVAQAGGSVFSQFARHAVNGALSITGLSVVPVT